MLELLLGLSGTPVVAAVVGAIAALLGALVLTQLPGSSSVDDGDPISGPPPDPHVLFTEAGLRAGLIVPGEALKLKQIDFAVEIITLCKRIVERFESPASPGNTVGDLLRERLLKP